MSSKEYIELKNALASTRMEDYSVTQKTERDCVRLMLGEVSIAELVKEILSCPIRTV